MSDKNQRPVDARVLEEASRALWSGGDAEFVPAEALEEAAQLMFGGASASRPASDEVGVVNDWSKLFS